MKKKLPIIIFWAIIGALILCFFIKTIVDGVYYTKYGHLGSAPFYVYLLLNAVYFLLPTAIIFTVGYLYQRKSK